MAVLNLNGAVISNTTDIWSEEKEQWSLISVRKGSLTIKNGTLKAKANDCFAVDVRDGAELTLEDVTCYGNLSAVYAHSGKITINSGEFFIQQLNSKGQEYEFMLNCYDPAYQGTQDRNNTSKVWEKRTADIIVKGGKYHGFDPGNCQAEGKGTSFLADGYKSVALEEKDDNGLTVYEVVANTSE